ncbi:hypothetical protein ABZ477_17705 [Microbacterium sp. NPDC019599]|uniref:hypothetical protein n=1 Tax=Microbacterium sp. NPDC019599 TaxID=3154690 RepID=UPI0033F3F9CA
MVSATVPLGLLLPSEFLTSPAFQFLAAFVAINTIMYAALALAKLLPKVYLSDLVTRRGRRKETRSIHPDEPVGLPPK